MDLIATLTFPCLFVFIFNVSTQVFGFNEAMTKPHPPSNVGCYLAVIYAAIGFVFVALGTTTLGYEDHSQLLGGFGNIPSDWTARLPWIRHAEPENALSIPTWMVHFSSVYEYLFAMNLIWRYSSTTGNETWKWLTWAMLPLHGSSICAVTHHFFYNAPDLLFLVTMQAFLTLMGNITCMVAAFRIAWSNGWTFADLLASCTFGACCCCGRTDVGSESETEGGNERQHAPFCLNENGSSSTHLAIKLLLLVAVSSFVIKYGELGCDLPFNPNATVALILIVGIPAVSVLQYSILSLHAPSRSRSTCNGRTKLLGEGSVCDEETPLQAQSMQFGK